VQNSLLIQMFICLAAFWSLAFILRRDTLSLGLPVAYLSCLLLIHLPGAFVHAIGGDVLPDSHLTALGMYYTTTGVVCFVLGVALSRYRALSVSDYIAINRDQFYLYCVIAGWLFTFGLSWFGRIPTLSAAIEKGGSVWMLGVMLGLRAAVLAKDLRKAAIWLAALAVYPVLMLLFGGFLSYGSTAAIIAISVFVISTRSVKRVVVGALVVTVLGFNVSLNYLQQRGHIRDAVWGGAPLENRVDAALNIFREFKWFDPANDQHLNAIDGRLNQNYFVGLAAARIEDGQTNLLYGRSLWEGLISLVPRYFWPEKPVFGGSPKVVMEMTGLVLDENTSWGVGNVMEFQINFGTPGVMGGFLLLGWLIGFFDRRAALADCKGELGGMFRVFLPAVALIQPNGSLVELVSGSAAAFVAAYFWELAWGKLLTRELLSIRPQEHDALTGL
jgi:hypothetical protein